ncbi:MAG TPA: hypothetical protein PKW80_04260 [Bacteroidales bacterium]|nr:hypothetical protein [Bacteroidales bacterium]
MKTKSYIPLSTDLNMLVRHINEITGKTAQMLCYDFEPVCNTLVLSDGRAVLADNTWDQFLGCFDNGYNHNFIKHEELLRLTVAARCSIYETSILLLKLDFEKSVFATNKFIPLNEHLSFKEILDKHSKKFVPDKDSLWSMIDKWQITATLNRSLFFTAVENMMAEQIFFYSYTMVEELFGKNFNKEVDLVNSAGEDDGDKYLELQSRFRKLMPQFEKLSFDIIESNVYNQNITNMYMQTFGTVLVKLKELCIEFDILECKIRIKREHPEFSVNEVENAVDNYIQSKHKEIADYEAKINQSMRMMPAVMISGNQHFSSGDVSCYLSEIKATASCICRLAHPDLLSAEDLKKLSAEMLEELRSIWSDFLTLKKAASTNPSTIGYDVPDYIELETIRMKILQIYKKAGITSKGDDIIGNTVCEKIQYLLKANDVLEKNILDLTLQKQNLINNPVIKSYLKILNSTQSIENHHKDLIEEQKTFQDKILKLKIQFEQMFNIK